MPVFAHDFDAQEIGVPGRPDSLQINAEGMSAEDLLDIVHMSLNKISQNVEKEAAVRAEEDKNLRGALAKSQHTLKVVIITAAVTATLFLGCIVWLLVR